jgi:hypothetical protein
MRLSPVLNTILPELEDAALSHLGGAEWVVIVFDNDVNTYEEVMTVLIYATGCSAEEAYIEAWEIDHLGKSVVHHADEMDCQRVAAIIAQIGIRVEVTQE